MKHSADKNDSAGFTWSEIANTEARAEFTRVPNGKEPKNYKAVFSGEFQGKGKGGKTPTWTVQTARGIVVEFRVITKSVWVVDEVKGKKVKKAVVKVEGRVVKPVGLEVPIVYRVVPVGKGAVKPILKPASGVFKLTNQPKAKEFSYEITNSSLLGAAGFPVAGTVTFDVAGKTDKADMVNAIDVSGPEELPPGGGKEGTATYEVVFSHAKLPGPVEVDWSLTPAPAPDGSNYTEKRAQKGRKNTITTGPKFEGILNFQAAPDKTSLWPKTSVGVKEKKE